MAQPKVAVETQFLLLFSSNGYKGCIFIVARACQNNKHEVEVRVRGAST